MLNEDQRMSVMYTGLSNLLIAEKNLRWNRSQMLAAVNGAGIALLVPTLEAPEVHVAIGFVGILVCVFWCMLNERTQ